MKIAILSLQGGVEEHAFALSKAVQMLLVKCEIILARAAKDLEGIDGLIIPGGESTVMHKLTQREGMLDAMRKIKNIFGTCAGAIMLAKKIKNSGNGQRTLGLMGIEAQRNAYGRQSESFESDIEYRLEGTVGKTRAVFIRAPKIRITDKNVSVIAKHNGEIVACEQWGGGGYYLATSFHPELSTEAFHTHFLSVVAGMKKRKKQ